MLNDHGRVRCFSRKMRVFDISSSVRSPRIFTSGLWSVTTINLVQPWVKYLVCSKLHATANASPSTGAYLCSADDRKRDPANVIFHPSMQHSGVLDAH